jgi:ABC-type multidrug transport system ATPase subunit
VREHLEFVARLKGVPSSEREEHIQRILKKVLLQEEANK